MCKERELDFFIFVIYSLAEKWEMTPATVYKILNSTGILDNYIIPCYDMLHTQGKEYLVDDITEYAREKGVSVCNIKMIEKESLSELYKQHLENDIIKA